MDKISSIIFIALLISISSYAQEDEVEINYLWIDTVVTLDGIETRLVSDEVAQINCCMKSPKYSRVSKKVSRWIKENIDENYEGITPLKSLQDLALATAIVNDAVAKSEEDTSIRIVSYAIRCN